ncbi:diguanylate cyclase/phosphodiesterase with GAF sensor [Haloactinopolyspora alba]|uniref:Diguanylate cyclase/phosphodiesterase with GAF sensor n=1 Tax=Haloactinopolyspora alba TaxID=648780 RepID=A0A2P8D193_9ACTN|nr:bifunctional diguanylate cyclase/phosphodiesterase [Haloactinopolyspora alba]PSK90984.1 diguanylate cyclase/phosphodiesterase with GAF sensor [Haloactinopolyspora alba]
MKLDPETIQPLLKTLAESTDAISADLLAAGGGLPLAGWGSAADSGVRGPELTAMREAIRGVVDEVSAENAGDEPRTAEVGGYQVLAVSLRFRDFHGGVCVVRGGDRPWSGNDRSLVRMAATLTTAVLEAGEESGLHNRLDALVTYIASELMGVSALELGDTVYRVLGELGRYFSADTCFLRHNEPNLQASVLVDEWPRRPDVPDPDPLGVVPWETEDLVFSMVGDQREPFLVRPGDGQGSYQQRVHAGSGVEEVSMATVPLISGDTTRGVLGLIHFGDRIWTRAEVRALRAIASLLVQLDARVTAEENLHHQAYHDELTGMWNRRAFVENLTAVLVNDPNARVAVLFADMDRLKTVNDVLGHGVGDSFIQAVSARMRECVRPRDVVARLAGDEFVVVLHDVHSVEAAERAARRILDRIAEPLEVGGHAISRSASVGLALNGDGAGTVDELLGNADVALLEAKERGGDSVVSFNDELRSKLLIRADLELRLRTAISNDEMRLYFQPEFDLRDGRLTGVEALIRWQHPERGLLAADSFISVVEEINLAAELGRWVLEEACRQLALWKASSFDPPAIVRVNISAGELISSDFVDFVAGLLNRYGLAPAELGIEITESTVMREIDDVRATLNGLRGLGVTLAIDDFGTGYSSLAQLKELPVDILKIDRSFVSALAENSGDRAIVAAIVRLAEAFNLTTVAEGVEESAAVTTLLDLGCHRAQGFFMSKPLPANAVLNSARNPGVPLRAV